MKYPAYPALQSTQQVPLPPLPVHWQMRRLRFITSRIEQGWSPQCENQPAEEDAWGVMKVGCVNGHRFDATENKALPADLVPLEEYELRAGDVLVSRANTRELVGSAALVPADVRKRLLLCDKLFRLRPEDGIRPEFLVFVLRTPLARFHYERDATGASGSMQNIGQDTLKDVLVPLPPEEEQARIASFLDWKTGQIDALIGKKQALTRALGEQRAAFIGGNVAAAFDRQSARKTPEKASWLTELPAHWREVPLGYLVEFSGGMTPSMANPEYWGGDVPWVSPKDMKQARIGDSTDHVTELALAETGLTLVPEGAVLVVVRGMILAHSFPTAITTAPVTINQDMKALRCGELMDVEYLRWCLVGFSAMLCHLAQESAHGTRKLETETLKGLVMPVPPIEEQRAIAERIRHGVELIDALIASTGLNLGRLIEYRAALITAAVTGQIDVRGVAVPPPA